MRKLSAFGLLLICFLIITFSMNLIKETPTEGTNETNQEEAFSQTNETESVSVVAKHGILPEVHYTDYRDGLSANLKDNNPLMVQLLEGLKEESAGVAGWLVGFANADKIVFYNHAHLLIHAIMLLLIVQGEVSRFLMPSTELKTSLSLGKAR